jgi:hypothetical protein
MTTICITRGVDWEDRYIVSLEEMILVADDNELWKKLRMILLPPYEGPN